MPCNGVAVATATLVANQMEIWNSLPVEGRLDFLSQVLEKAGHAVGITPATLPNPYDLGTVKPGEVAFQKGPYLVHVKGGGKIIVSLAAGAPRSLQATTPAVQKLIEEGVEILTVFTRQAQVINTLIATGVSVIDSQTAPNGALVLTVEL